MIDRFFRSKKTLERLRSGPAGPYLDDLTEALQQERYRMRVVRYYVKAADSFGRWLNARGLAISQADDAHVELFVITLGRRRRAGRAVGRLPTAACGVRRFARHLSEQGIIAFGSPAPIKADEECLTSFAVHLERQGLASGTRQNYLRVARRFIHACFGDTVPDWRDLTTEQVTDFVRSQAVRLKSASRGGPGRTTRAFLRFLVMKALVPATIVSAIPTIRQWKLAALPRYLSEEEVSRVLAACPGTPVGCRNRAILKLLVRAGLRAGEVMRLQLDDIDWHAGEIRIRAGKSGRERVLPLMEDVGKDVISYLRSRPGSNDRAIFLKGYAPYRALKCSASVSLIATACIKRAGLSSKHSGAHVFRHTAATQMMSAGAIFKQVADVLGHQSLETTAIYAKLELPKLASVAMPWPGGWK